MTEIPGMILWTDAYFGDTHHLTTFEHGAYLLILMAMWRNGGKLANSSKNLAMLAHVTPDKWGKIEKKIMDFMTIVDGSDGTEITQKRLRQEYGFAQSRNAKRIEAGRMGGMAKSLKSNKSSPSNAGSNVVALPDNFNFNSNYKKDSLNGELRQKRGTAISAGIVFVKEETEQWNAWIDFYRKSGKIPPSPICRKETNERGWYFPTERPPIDA